MSEQSLSEVIETLEDGRSYTVFFGGAGRHAGSFRVDNATGAQIKHLHMIFDFYTHVEIYPKTYEPGTGMYELMEAKTAHALERRIKDSYHGPSQGEPGEMKTVERFLVTRIDKEGRYSRQRLSGAELSGRLAELIRGSRTLTLIEEDSPAWDLFRQAVRRRGELKIHLREIHFSEITAAERVRYRIADDYKADPFESVDNVIEHHKD